MNIVKVGELIKFFQADDHQDEYHNRECNGMPHQGADDAGDENDPGYGPGKQVLHLVPGFDDQ
jgi:hypothetical protein